MLSILIVFNGLFFASCNKVDMRIKPITFDTCALIPGYCDTSKLEIVWQRPIFTDTSEWGSIGPYIYGDCVFFSQFTYGEATDTIFGLDKKNGNKRLIWHDYFTDKQNKSINNDKFEAIGNKLIFTTWDDVYCVNADNLRTIWCTRPISSEGHPRITLTHNNLYHVNLERKNRKTVNSYLVATNTDVGNWHIVHNQPILGNLQPCHELPVLWMSPTGDSILLFQIRYIDIPGGAIANRIDIVAYNPKKREEYFRFENVDIPSGGGSVCLPYIVGNKAFVPLTREVVAIDMLNRNIIWRKDFGLGANFRGEMPFIYVENQFFVKPANRTLYQLDIETGSVLWQDLDNGSNPSNIVYHDGVIYYTCNGNAKIYALEVATKKRLWAEPSPNIFRNKWHPHRKFSNANIGFGGIAIDAELGYLYTSDFYFLMCIKLPKR